MDQFFKLNPYPFQKEGIRFALEHHYCIIGDEMGLGKTPEGIGISLVSGSKATLVICPASLKLNWEVEINKFSKKKQRIFVCMDSKGVAFAASHADDYDFIIGNYEQLQNDNMGLLFNWADYVIAEEGHYLKNIKAIRTKAFHQYIMMYKPKRFTVLTGTPISGNVGDWYSLIKLCSYNPSKTSGEGMGTMSYYGFCEKFSHRKTINIGGRSIVKYEGIRNVDGLKALLKGKYIRRLKKDVLDLPKVIEREVIVDFKDVEGMQEEWDKYLEETKDSIYATAKMESAKAKSKFTVKYCKDLHDSGASPLIVFTAHLESLQIIAQGLEINRLKVRVIQGDVSPNERHQIVQLFQAGKLDAVVCSIQAASVGLTLTRSSNMVFNDLHPNPIFNAQALARFDRIGQTVNPNVHFIIKGMFDRKMTTKLREKIITIRKAV